jgi:spore maturation protein CgeB
MKNSRLAVSADWAKKGFRIGWEHGYHLGCSKGILERLPSEHLTVNEIRVLFIPQGFEAIDQGVILGLQQTASEFFVASAETMLQRAMELKPDLVLVLNGLHVFPAEHLDHVDQIKAMGIKTAIWFADDPYFTDLTEAYASRYDFIFTHERSCVSLYQELGCRHVHYLPLAVNPLIYRPMQVDSSYRTDICFIGNAFPNRIELFDQLAHYLADKKVMIAGSLWDQLTHYPKLKNSIRLEWIPIEETVKYYNGAKIVINLHRSPNESGYSRNNRNIPARSINPRTYEISACGAFQLTDLREDLTELYTPGFDIVSYQTADELIGQMDYYLRHEKKRKRIALRGLKQTHSNHTFGARLSLLLQEVQQWH